jgi:hypothetical protein
LGGGAVPSRRLARHQDLLKHPCGPPPAGQMRRGQQWLRGAPQQDQVWFTCCALHNWLLDIDGLSEKWVGDVGQCISDWDGEMGCLDFDGARKEVPNALARLFENLETRNYDSSGLGPGLDVIGEMRSIFTQEIRENMDNDVVKQISVGEESVRNVQFLSLAIFR